MSIAINLSPTLTDQLQHQASILGVSLNELIENLIYKGLSRKSESGSQSETVSSETLDTDYTPSTTTQSVANTTSNGPTHNG